MKNIRIQNNKNNSYICVIVYVTQTVYVSMYMNKQIYVIMSLLWDLKYQHVIINTSIIIYQQLYCIVLIIWGMYVILYQNMYIYIASLWARAFK